MNQYHLTNKIYKFILLLLLLFLSCSSKKNHSNSEKIGFYIEATTGKWKHEDGYNYLSILTTLKNNSSDTIKYIGFSCSWDMSYLINNNSQLQLYRTECNKNVPKVFAIPPYS